MNFTELEAHELFTTNGKDVWKREGYFSGPSCTLKNLETGEKQTFGLNGLTADSFKPLAPVDQTAKR